MRSPVLRKNLWRALWIAGTMAATAGPVAQVDDGALAEEMRLLQISGDRLLALYTHATGSSRSTNSLLARRSVDGGATWTDLAGRDGATTLVEGVDGGFDACADRDGAVYVITAERGGLSLMKLSRAESTWTSLTPVMLQKGSRFSRPTLCLDGTGTIWTACHFTENEGRVGIRVLEVDAKALGTVRGRHNVSYGFGGTVQQLVMRQNRPVLFYSGSSAWESAEIYWTVFDGRHWPRASVGIGQCARSPGSFRAVADDEGALHVTWRDFGGSTPVVWYQRQNIDGRWLDAPVELCSSRHASGQVLTSDGGRVWCLWDQRDAGELRGRCFTDGTWQPDARLGEAPSTGQTRLCTPKRIMPAPHAIPVLRATGPGGKAPARKLEFMKFASQGELNR